MTSGDVLISSRRTGLENHAVGARLRVADWMACAPGLEEKADWLAWTRGETPRATEPPAQPALPAPLRRRVSAIGQMAFRAVHGLPQTPHARFIFCSRHGEYRRTKALFEALAKREPTSPAEFSLSVHNALVGLLSIAWANDAGHTAVAAGVDSFGFGLLEAAACLAGGPQDAILLVYFDEPLPGEYGELRRGDDDEASVALALLLTPAQGDGQDLILSLEPKPPGEPAQPATAQALDFLRFLLSGEREALSSGGSIRWRWRRAAA